MLLYLSFARQQANLGGLLTALREMGNEVLVIDESMAKVQHIIDEQLATEGICFDATNIHALRQLGLASFDAVVLAIGENLQELGVRRIVVSRTDGCSLF